MLSIAGPRSRYCDGVSRRTCLQIGALGLGGLALPEVLRCQAEAAVGRPLKGIIMILQPGGPTHIDSFDLKPDAPAEVSKQRICEDEEVMLVVKTSTSRVDALEKRLRELHPYDCPEVVRIAPAHVDARYLAWLLSAVG